MTYEHPIYTAASVDAQRHSPSSMAPGWPSPVRITVGVFTRTAAGRGSPRQIAGGALVMAVAPSREDATASSRDLGPRLPALYAAVVTHTRRSPIKNRFRHRASYWLVDYDELPRPGGFAGAWPGSSAVTTATCVHSWPSTV